MTPGATALWFPSQTTGGALAEDRIVLPIPADTYWRDAKPLVLPGVPVKEPEPEMPKTLPGGALVRPRPERPELSAAQKAAIKRSQSKHLKGVPLGKKAVLTGSGFKYVDRTDYVPELDAPAELEDLESRKPKRARKPRQKHDPKYIAATRELRDRYLEAVNERGLLPEAWTDGKYDVSRHRELEAPDSTSEAESRQTHLLDG